METEPIKPPTAMPPPTPAEPAANQALPEAATSPWEAYLTGKKAPATRFLAKMDAARAKGGLSLPDDATRNRFAEALAAKPDRVARLVALLQACPPYSDTVRRIVVEFAEAGIKRLGTVTFPEPLDATAFRATVSNWLAGLRKKPLKPAELNLLFLFLQIGWQRQILDHDTAFHLVASAVAKPAKAQPKKAAATKPAPTPLEVLLAATPGALVLSTLLAHAEAAKVEADKLNTQIQAQAVEIVRLTANCAVLNGTISELRADIATLEDKKAAAENKVTELEKQVVDIRDGYQHKLDELRGRIRGVLQGQLTRWLQTALDASRSDPPWTEAIQERLEDALRLIERETQWLQPSA